MAETSVAQLRQHAPAPAQQSPVKAFSDYLERLKPQMAMALPKHMKADRMARLALSAFSSSPDMQRCDFRSIASSLMTAGAMGLEPGVNGAGYLIPYKGVCTFVPGWKGMQDLVNRSGRATTWTGAVFEGDQFEYELGDRPFVRHRPGDENDPKKLTHVYAVGRINGSEFPVIEVWTVRKVWKHRDTLNKQGTKHYSLRHPEMYARKVVLLQVLKYMPTSVEIANAIAASEAAELGRPTVIDGDFVTVQPGPDDLGVDQETGEIVPRTEQAQPTRQTLPPAIGPDDGWMPSPEEEAAIRQRELAEAQADRPAQQAQATAQPSSRRERRPSAGASME